MAIDNETVVAQAPAVNGYGRFIRERGTVKVILLAAAALAAYWAYGALHQGMMNQKQWPVLKADVHGLTVLGLRDKDRPGWKRRYQAIERSKSWIFRRPDDLDSGGGGETADEGTDAADRGNNPGAGRRLASGEIVDPKTLLSDPDIPVVLLGRHFSSASIEERVDPLFERHYSVVTVNLTDEGRSRYFQFASKHEGERLVFLLDAQPLTCPKMDSMDVGTLEIQPIWDRNDAVKLRDFINGQK